METTELLLVAFDTGVNFNQLKLLYSRYYGTQHCEYCPLFLLIAISVCAICPMICTFFLRRKACLVFWQGLYRFQVVVFLQDRNSKVYL